MLATNGKGSEGQRKAAAARAARTPEQNQAIRDAKIAKAAARTPEQIAQESANKRAGWDLRRAKKAAAAAQVSKGLFDM